MTFALIYILLALIPAAVASGRGHSGFGMFLVSLLLSPLIGLALALFMKPKAAEDEARARKGLSRTHRVCPHCAEVVRRDATTCKHCGKPLPAPPPLGKDYAAIAAYILLGILALMALKACGAF